MMLEQFEFNGYTVEGFRDYDSDEVWVVLKDVCGVLGIANHRDVASRLDNDEKRVSVKQTPGGPQKTLFVNESGLYEVIFASNKPEAKRFTKWITKEVIPSIRRTGRYEVMENRELQGLLFELPEKEVARQRAIGDRIPAELWEKWSREFRRSIPDMLRRNPLPPQKSDDSRKP